MRLPAKVVVVVFRKVKEHKDTPMSKSSYPSLYYDPSKLDSIVRDNFLPARGQWGQRPEANPLLSIDEYL